MFSLSSIWFRVWGVGSRGFRDSGLGDRVWAVGGFIKLHLLVSSGYKVLQRFRVSFSSMWEFPKVGVPYLGVLTKRILLFGLL